MTVKTFTGTPETKIQGNNRDLDLDWYEFIVKLAEQCTHKYGLKKKSRWRKYHAHHFWEVIVFAILNSLGTEDAAERWNIHKWKRFNENKRRKRKPRKYGGTHERHERMAPDRSQVNDFKRRFPRAFIEKLSSIVLREQVFLARKLGLLNKTIDVFVDFTPKPYHGALKADENDGLHGTNRARGTNRVRKYLGVMVKSGRSRLFSHLVLAKSGAHRHEYVNNAIEELISWGFVIRRITGDREFVSRRLIDRCIKEDIHYFGPFIKTVNVKKKMKHFLEHGGTGVYRYGLKGGGYWNKKNPADTRLIFNTKEEIGLKGIRKKFMDGKITLKEAMEKIHVFISTKPLPRARRQREGQKRAWVKWYSRRWWIETAFRDLNAFFPTVHARTDAAKTLAMSMRAFLYNAWLIHRDTGNWNTRKTEFCYIVELEQLKSNSFAVP